MRRRLAILDKEGLDQSGASLADRTIKFSQENLLKPTQSKKGKKLQTSFS